ncbi:MAG: hypothetical protein V5B44_11150 [Candidatus Accumulibacter necessarius]|uniref:hypothetical protein n=1 Tax=Candidatus Accumulibacter necessarius TaxID=2954386 RepID=UPI002FC2BEDB
MLWRSARRDLARTFRRCRARRAVAGRRDGFAEARQRPDDAAHEEAGDQQDGDQVAARNSHRSEGSACGSKRGGGSSSHQRSLAGHEADPQAAALPRPPCRSSTGSPRLVGRSLAGGGQRELWLSGAGRAAIGPQLQSLLAGIGSAQSLPGACVEPWQDDLQQAHLAGDQLDRLIDVRGAAEMPEEREGGEFRDGDDGDHQQHGATGQRGGKESQLHSAGRFRCVGDEDVTDPHTVCR